MRGGPDMKSDRMTVPEQILNVLKDGRAHFSAEFRDRLGLLEYRKPITRLRRRVYEIKALDIWDEARNCFRPGYVLQAIPEGVLHGA